MDGPPGDPLLAGLAAGCDEAFAALYDRDGAALFRVAVALLGCRADAEDAVQEVFVSLAQAGASLAAVENLRAYLFAALRHAAAKSAARRRADRRRPFPDAFAAPEPRTTADERLERALAALPADRREVIALKIDGGLTFREIAAVLGVSPNTAASRYRYALAELRDALARSLTEHPPMTEPELPADLAALERRLADRPRVAPSAGLGPRVLDATRLAQRPRPAAAAWRSWAALAAAVLVGVNLSMSVAENADWRLTAGVEPGQIAATADRLRAAAPELSERELRRQALLVRAGAGLTPTADLNPYREPDRWDVR